MSRVRESLVVETVPPGYYDSPGGAKNSAKLALTTLAGIVVLSAVVGTGVGLGLAGATSGCNGNSEAGTF